MLDDWVRVVKDLKGGLEGTTPDSVNPSVVDDQKPGLPLPPLDDLSCLIAYDTSIGFYNLLDGLDDEELSIKKQATTKTNRAIHLGIWEICRTRWLGRRHTRILQVMTKRQDSTGQSIIHSFVIAYDKSLLDGLDDEELPLKKQATMPKPIQPSILGSAEPGYVYVW